MSEKTVKFMESTVVQNVIIALKGDGIAAGDPEHIKVGLETILESTSDFLRITKSKSSPKTALVYNDKKGNMIVAAVVEYNENESEEGQDNYNYYWTFDKEDITGDDVKLYEGNQSQVQTMFINCCSERHYLDLNAPAVTSMTTHILGLISDYLTENAKEGEEIKLVHEGYFTASAVVEDGEIVKSFLPEGPMKVLIKDDVTVEA